MKISELKNLLHHIDDIKIVQPDGNFVPPHFHITEAGLTTKKFIDCGNTIRESKNISFQIWIDNDVEHRLKPHKLLKIIDTAQHLFGEEDLNVEVEYQADTIGIYNLTLKDNLLYLVNKNTDCLAKEICNSTPMINLITNNSDNCCTSSSSCC